MGFDVRIPSYYSPLLELSGVIRTGQLNVRTCSKTAMSTHNDSLRVILACIFFFVPLSASTCIFLLSCWTHAQCFWMSFGAAHGFSCLPVVRTHNVDGCGFWELVLFLFNAVWSCACFSVVCFPSYSSFLLELVVFAKIGGKVLALYRCLRLRAGSKQLSHCATQYVAGMPG